jgi:hypothetical protein
MLGVAREYISDWYTAGPLTPTFCKQAEVVLAEGKLTESRLNSLQRYRSGIVCMSSTYRKFNTSIMIIKLSIDTT